LTTVTTVSHRVPPSEGVFVAGASASRLKELQWVTIFAGPFLGATFRPF
jgi:hypothetical protein